MERRRGDVKRECGRGDELEEVVVQMSESDLLFEDVCCVLEEVGKREAVLGVCED